jgi:cell division cycle 20, cofactor of APC complex
VTSVAWAPMELNGQELLAVGCNSAEIQLWDATTQKLIRTLPGHTARVSSLSWNPTSCNMLSSGSRDAKIFNHDIRLSRGSNGGGVVSTLMGHKQEVCGLRWNHSGNTLASGGNENYLCLWDVAQSGHNNNNNNSSISPRLILTDHKAAVKALAWAPFKSSLLASGGGTADRCIKYWNIHTGNLVSSTDTGSQVCSLLWSPNRKEIVSGHGFSQNQLVLWKYPTMTKMMEFTGHTARVLHLDQSPDGSSIVSAGADETLRFWKIFGPSNRMKSSQSSPSSFHTVEPITIR